MIALPSRRSMVYAAVCDEAPHGGLALRETGPADAPRARLLDRVRTAIRTRHYSRRTEEAYVAPEITRFLSSLAVDGQVAASTQNQALSALLFLYREVLEGEAGRPCRGRAPAR